MSQLLASTWRRWINALRDPHPIRSHRNPHPASPPSRRQQVTCRLEQLEERALLSGGPPFPNNLTPPALPAPTGNVVQVSTAAQLASAVANLTSGETVLINPGTYNLSDTLYLPQNISNVAIRGATGKSADVVIQGAGMSGNILFGFWAGNVSGVTFADMTIQGFADHGIILNAGVQSPLIHDVHLVDCGQQFIKSNPNPSGGGVNNGVVEYCTIEYSTTAPTYYTNGVDVHTGNNWVIRDNVFRNIRTVGALAGPAVLVWDGSSGAVTEANTFINCQRDIAYGFNDATTNDNTGGIIRNNFIAETTSIGGDVGIYVCNSPNTQVLNNTLWMNSDYPDAIEYRYTDTTGVQVLDNLTNAAIVSRDGGSATLANNITNAPSSWFVNTATGDLHLVATATGAINLVQPLTNVATDYDGQARPYGLLADIGADEYVPTTITDTQAPVVSVTSPAAGAYVRGTVSVTASATDNVGVTGVQFYVDGVAAGSLLTASPYAYAWDTTKLADGTHTLSAKAYDAAGNVGSSASVSVLVDNTAPTVTAVSPAAGATGANPSGSITVTFSEGVDPTTVNTSTLQLRDASGNLVADTVSYNATSHVATLTPGASLAFSTTYSAVVHGGSAGVKDLAGNALAADYSWSFTTAAQAAAPTANAGPNQTAAEGSPVQFSGSASGGQGSLTYSWAFGDGGTATGTLTPSHVYQEAGNYTATLTVTDGLGRSSQSSAAVTVTEVTPTANAGGPYSAAPGAAMSFTGGATDSPADVSAGLKYSWNFGDGGTSTQQNPSHTYATAGNYTVTLTVTDADGLTASSTASVTVSSQTVAPVTTPTITTPYLTIPNFGAAPTVFSIKSGNWSDPTVWSLGRLPRAGDVVDINPGTTITYDLNDSTDSVALKTVEVQPTATLTFRTDVNTQICVGNFLVLPGGNLIVGTAANPIAANVHANIDIANQAINGVLDPQQFGTGLIVLGNVTMHGAVKTPYATLAVEPRAGDTTLKFASPVSGWQAGDELVVPDTRQLDDSTRGGNYKPQWEQVVVKSVSADGLTVTLSAPLKYDHLGARDANGVLDYLPQVMNLDRNIMVESQSMTGTRGYTLYTGNANVDIEYAGFCELGRTVNAAPSSTNVADRYAMTLLNLIGPATPQANGHQFTLIGNVVDNDGDGNANNPSNIQWGIALNNSYYGLIQSNDVWSVAGVGIGVEDGASSYNVFDRNFVANVTGTSGRTDQQMQGDGFWFHNPNNYVTNNIATDVNAGASDVYSYGFMVNASAGGTGAVGTVAVPAYQGADPSQAGQSKSLNMNATPLLGFSGNEVYGATSRGFSTWWLGTQYETPMGTAGTLKNSVVWNQSNAGYFTYETNGLTIDGFVVRGDASQLSNPFNYTTGIFFGDYMTRNAVVQNVDIQDEATGLAVPSNVGRGGATDVVTFTVQNSYLRNIINIAVPLLESSNGGSGLSARKVIIQNVQFAQPAAALPSGTQPYNIYMDDSRPYDASSYNTTSPTLVYVYGYNDNASDNFQVFFNSTKPANAITRALVYGFVVPM